MDISEAHVHHRLEFRGDLRDGLEELVGLLDGHFQHVVDVLALVADGEGVLLVAAAAALVAGHMDRREEVHLDDLDARALALLAASAGDVEGEAAGLETPHLGVLRILEQEADVVEHAGEGGRIRPRRAADGRLVDLDELVDVLHPLDSLVRQGFLLGAVELLLEDGHERFIHQGTLSATGKTGHADEAAQRETGIYPFEVIASGALQREETAVSLPAPGRNGDVLVAF